MKHAALYYHPEGYTTTAPKLMGRHAAGETFLRSVLQHTRPDAWTVLVEDAAHARHFEQTARAAGRKEPVRVVQRKNLADLAQAGALHYPGPSIGKAAWERSLFGHGLWSLTGITHTTSSAGAMDSIVEWLTAPVQSWDAVICTSTAVKAHVQHLLDTQFAHFRQRLGATRMVLPQLPVIPLGIHTQDFQYGAKDRAAARRSLGITDDRTQVVLFMGRLSFHAKAHPLAMYEALESAAQRSGVPVVLVECGWHANDAIAQSYAQAAAQACPSVRVVHLDGRKPEMRRTAWAGADVFCSLSDNIQETFGITPIEAMAAGLPVVVSDWDGYRDTVRHGLDGFRIPTLMPQEALGGDLSARHALGIDNYDFYCGHTCMFVGMDVPLASVAFEQLFTSPELRRSMGEQGRRRAREVYDWAVIMPQYEALWSELQARRQREAAGVPGAMAAQPTPWPARADPFTSFAGYPSRRLTPDTPVALVEATVEASLAKALACKRLRMVTFAAAVLPSDADIEQILKGIGSNIVPGLQAVAQFPDATRPQAFRALAWLIKMNVLRPAEALSVPADSASS